MSNHPAPAPSERGYSIRVASRLSGLPADTLRMWERRYGFPKPARSEQGVRVYSDAEVERLALIARALQAGYRTGEVIHAAADQVRDMITAASRPAPVAPEATASHAGLLEALRVDDPDALRNELRRWVAQLGPRRFLVEVAAPTVEEVGEAWAAGRLDIRHEHLFSYALRTQLRLLLSAYEGQTGGPVVMLTTLPHERHGLGLDMVALYLALGGVEPRLLGVDTPTAQIVEAARALGASVVGLGISRGADLAAARVDVEWLLGALPPEVELWLGGQGAREIRVSDPRLRRAVTWAELDQAIEALLARHQAPRRAGSPPLGGGRA